MTCQSFFGRQLRQFGQQAIDYAAAKAASDPRWRNLSRPSALAAAIFIMPAIAVAAAYFSRPSPSLETAISFESVTIFSTPDVSAQIEQIAAASSSVSRIARTVRNEPFSRLLSRLGITDPMALEVVNKHRPDKVTAALRNATSGQLVTARVFPSGDIKTLSLYQEHKDMTGTRITLSRTVPNGNLTISSQKISFRMHADMISGRVVGSVDRSLSKAELPAPLIRQVHGIFDQDRDPLMSLGRGDQFWIIFEKKQADGHVIGYGRPLAVIMRRGQRTLAYYWFDDGSTDGGYYDENGKNVRRSFVRVPLDVRVISSGFNRMRKHPITGVVRPHLGTDFSAPRGAIVRAASDGVVRRAGWGTGYGKHILIDHGNGYETVYAHLSEISKDVRPGAQVEISQQIGRVGMTGLATGPHLHYELRLHKQQINPMTAQLPTVRNLPSHRKGDLKVAISQLEKRFELPTKSSSVHTAQTETDAPESKNKAN